MRSALKLFRSAISPLLLALLSPLHGATISKLYDFNNSGSNESVQNPYDTPIVIGNELWFTSEKGGEVGFGTVSSFNLANNTLTLRVGDLGVPDDETFYDQGNTPTSSLVRDGNVLYYTTTKGGTGDKGTLNAYDMATGTNTVLWNSPSSSPNTNPNTPSGSVAVVDRGELGKDVYFMTGNGGDGAGTGSGTGLGTIQRYNTLTGLTTTVHEFSGGATEGRQPFEGFTKVGNALYFTTFTGGNSGTGASNGVGTLGMLDVTTSGGEVLSTLAMLPLGDGSTRFAAHNPFYSTAANSLFFTTVGNATQPGSLQSYDMTTGTLTTLYELTGAATSSGPFPEGRFIYGSVYQWEDSLFYTTIQGGLYGGGTINEFNLETGTNSVLFDLDSTTGDNLGGEARGGLVFSDWDGLPSLYLLTRQGGMYDHGTLLRIYLTPEPSRMLLLMSGLTVVILRRRRPTVLVSQVPA